MFGHPLSLETPRTPTTINNSLWPRRLKQFPLYLSLNLNAELSIAKF